MFKVEPIIVFLYFFRKNDQKRKKKDLNKDFQGRSGTTPTPKEAGPATNSPPKKKSKPKDVNGVMHYDFISLLKPKENQLSSPALSSLSSTVSKTRIAHKPNHLNAQINEDRDDGSPMIQTEAMKKLSSSIPPPLDLPVPLPNVVAPMTEIMMKLGILEADPDTKSMISNIADHDSKSIQSKQPIKSAKPKKKLDKLKRALKGLKSVKPIIIPREDSKSPVQGVHNPQAVRGSQGTQNPQDPQGVQGPLGSQQQIRPQGPQPKFQSQSQPQIQGQPQAVVGQQQPHQMLMPQGQQRPRMPQPGQPLQQIVQVRGPTQFNLPTTPLPEAILRPPVPNPTTKVVQTRPQFAPNQGVQMQQQQRMTVMNQGQPAMVRCPNGQMMMARPKGEEPPVDLKV